MAKATLPRGLQGSENLPQTQTALVNCFFASGPEGELIIPRPGIDQLGVSFTNRGRGTFSWNGSLYTVFGTTLYKITDLEAGTPLIIGTILGSSPVKAVPGFNDIVLMAKDTALYTLDKLDFLTEITSNQNFVSVTDVTHINGKFVYIPTDGEPAFFSDVGVAGTVQPLSFFDAEELPDLNNAVFEFANTLYIGGTDSFELFRDTGGTPNPFTRISGARHRYGYIGGLLEYTDSFLFLGREKGQDFGFYSIGPGSTQKISNPFIDKILAGYAPEELGACVSGRIKWRGYDLATFTLARDSFGFYAGEWFKLNTLIDGFPRPWLGGFIAQHNGVYYSSSRLKLGKFAAINTDFDERVARSMDLGIKHPNNQRFSCQSIGIGISQGFNAAVGTVGLFMSRDNRVYGPGLFKSLGAKGKYHDKLTWNPPGGLGSYDGFMGVRIYTTGDVSFAADSLFLDIR